MVFAFVLLLLLIFVLQNGQRAEVSFLGAHGTLPMGVALLLAAVFGVLLVALPGTARIVQLRMFDRRPVTQPVGPHGPGPTPPSSTGIAAVPLPPRPPRADG
ncbi:LapA family protein [Micromonospora schwarzwaldensis]|uniref:LapA family protein n=1 Tax=Micromonospora sp. DSM 45708 TaxID=3111767 RepID=UPI0031D246ED